MKYLIVLLIISIFIKFIPRLIRKIRNRKSTYRETQTTTELESKETINYRTAYKAKWMFTYNEKNIYYKLENFAKANRLRAFAKVRLFDLVEPRNKADNKLRWKIQAKHVDFVLCTENLVAKYIIELDDSSHNRTDREDRDIFVDQILTSCGYQILHMNGYEEEKLLKLIGKGTLQETKGEPS